MEENDIKEKLFGSIGRIERVGNCPVPVEELVLSLEWSESVMRTFCTGCGSLVEVNRNLAEDLAIAAKIELPENPGDYYFKTDKCALCTESEDADLSVQLLALPKS